MHDSLRVSFPNTKDQKFKSFKKKDKFYTFDKRDRVIFYEHQENLQTVGNCCICTSITLNRFHIKLTWVDQNTSN